jgi:hypothetical protein
MYDGSVCRTLRYERNVQSIISWFNGDSSFGFSLLAFMMFKQLCYCLGVWVINEMEFSGDVLSVLSIYVCLLELCAFLDFDVLQPG